MSENEAITPEIETGVNLTVDMIQEAADKAMELGFDDVIEAEVVKSAEPAMLKPEDYNPEDVAAAFFSLNHKRLLINLKQLSKNQLIRVCYHAATQGLGAKNTPLRDELEKNTAYIMNEMVTNRVIMQLHLEMEKAEKASLTEQANNDIMKPSLEQAVEKTENKNGETN